MRSHVARITSKGQVTIPIDVRRRLGLAPHDNVAFLLENDQVRIAPATSVVAMTAGLLKDKEPMLSPQEEKAAAERAIAEDVAKPVHRPGHALKSRLRGKR